MARGVNKVILVGHVGQDPEVRYSPSETAIANLSLATNSYWKDRQTGEDREKTEWHRLVFFNRTAEIVEQYVRKGSQIYVEGRLQTRKWQDQNGQDRYTTEIVVHELQLLGGRSDSSQSSGFNEDSSFSKPSEKSAEKDQSFSPSDSADPMDDDIPF